MTIETGADCSNVKVVPESDVPMIPIGLVGTQQILLGAPRADGSPLLLGITRVAPGCTTPLIEHDTAEIAYVLAGEGAIVTEDGQREFGPGSAILINARCWHAVRAGKAEVAMIFAFPSPSVPETRQWQA